MAQYKIKDGVGIIPKGTKRIEESAFLWCDELTVIFIPDSVTEIGDRAFNGCKGLTSIVIPDSVTEIGENAFEGCTGLTSIVVSEGNKVYDSRNNCNAIIETATNKLIAGFKDTLIPDSVTEIGDSAFSDCKALTSIVIPDSATKIGEKAFKGCTGLTSIVISDSVMEIGAGAFEYCKGLTSIVIPDSVTEIKYYTFRYCYALTSLVIGKSVTKIDSSAFEPDNAGEGCTCLTSIVVSGGNKVYDSRDNCNAIIETSTNKLIYGCKNAIIPNSVTEIGCEAFKGTGLTSIVIPNSVTKIGGYAFEGCKGLTSIVIPDSVTEIEKYAFMHCTGLTSLVIGILVTEIGRSAFTGCTGLTSIVIPNSVTKIGEGAFEDCTGLTSIVIPDSVTEIGVEAFSGCTGLTSIVVAEGNKVYDSRNNCNALIETATNTLLFGCKTTVIPDSVTGIGWGAFKGCTGLTSIVIPDSVTVIRNAAFGPCKDLKSVTFEGNLTEIEFGAFNCCSSLEKINVPAKRAAYYKKLLPQELKRLVVESSQEAATAKKTLVKKSPVKEISSAKKTPVKKATVKKHEIALYPENCYRLVLLPVVGEESNQLIDENGFDLGTFYSIDQISADEFGRNYEFFLDFYSSEDGIEYTVNNKTRKALKDNALNIDNSKFDLEEAGQEPDDDFILVGNLTKANVKSKEIVEIFNDIMARHNNATEDEHVDIVFDAICRRMRQVAEQLVEEGLAEDVKSVRFALQFGTVQGVEYTFEIETDRFNSKLLRTINCEDWNDCPRRSDTLLEYWPDRLLGCIVYDGKLYEGMCNKADDYDFLIDLVDCEMKSLQ